MTIAAYGVCINRARKRIVSGANLLLEDGQWTGLVGANGSGKTTLMQAIAGRIPVLACDLTINGVQCDEDRIFRAQNIGYAPNVQDLPSVLSGNEYLAVMTISPTDHEPLEGLAAALDFKSFGDLPIDKMSAGMKQRIAIYSAFINGHKTIFLDEPFNWLDPVVAYRTKQALRAMVQEQGYTLLTALHDVATLTAYCDKGYLMADGKIMTELGHEQLAEGARDVHGFEASMIASLA